jgi:RNA polymerase sigma-70 factor (ECF subfamily)
MLGSEDDGGWCERLYEREATRLLLYGRALGLDHLEAEDLLHDTFSALLRLGAAPKEPTAYLIRSFRNRALNHRRSLWRRVRREFESRRWFEVGNDQSAAESAAMRMLPDLPIEQREVIVLKIWQGLTFDEIGHLTGVSPNTVAGRYRYGLQKLRIALKEDSHEESGIMGGPIGCVGATRPVS